MTASVITVVPAAGASADRTTVPKSISTINITTEDLSDPPYEFFGHPEGYWGNSIKNNNYVTCTVEYYDPNIDKRTVIDTNASVKIRGNTSALKEKKPYKLKFNKKQSFNTDGKSKKWVLLNYGTDLNFLFSNFSSEYCGIEWQPSFEYVNVEVNGDYKGCYVLVEAVEQMTKDLSFDSSGFMIENDAYWWKETEYFRVNGVNEHMAFTYKEPDPEDTSDSQKRAIQKKMNDASANIMADNDTDYLHSIDLDSFVSWYLAKDYQGNADAAGSNMYWYATSLYSPLKMGPAWDFDSDYSSLCDSKWSHIHYRDINFADYLFEKDSFKKAYREKFEETLDMRNSLPAYINNFYKTYGDSLQESWDRDAERWNTEAGDVNIMKNHYLKWYEKRQKLIDIVTADWNKTVDIADAEVKLSSDKLVYNGRPQMPKVTVTYNGKTLVEDHDYTVNAKNYTNTGKATLYISGIGRYAGTTKLFYYIIPSKQILTAKSDIEGTIDLSWKADPQADGYQIMASTNKSFSTSKSYIINDKTKSSGIVCGLTSGRVFYVRIRSFKIVDDKKIPGVASDVVAVLTK